MQKYLFEFRQHGTVHLRFQPTLALRCGGNHSEGPRKAEMVYGTTILISSKFVFYSCIFNIDCFILKENYHERYNWASSRENLSSGFQQSEFQTSLLSHRDYLENWNFTCAKFTYDIFQKANNKGADQTARMRRLVCACVVRNPPMSSFLGSRPI